MLDPAGARPSWRSRQPEQRGALTWGTHLCRLSPSANTVVVPCSASVITNVGWISNVYL